MNLRPTGRGVLGLILSQDTKEDNRVYWDDKIDESKIHFDIYPIFSIFSALHFRHQFAFMYPFNLLAACTLLSLTGIRPDVVYAFLAFVHTPHQYYVFHPYICNNKELSIFLILSISVTLETFQLLSGWLKELAL